MDVPDATNNERTMWGAARAGTPTAAIRLSDDVLIAVDPGCMDALPGAQVGIALRSGFDQFVAHFTMAMVPARLGKRQRYERATARIRNPRLAPGQYMVDVAVAIDGVRIFDYVVRGASFRVHESDVYGTGYQVKAEQGVVYLTGDWAIEPLELPE